MLDELDRDFEVKSVFKLCPANADGDNLIIDGITFPLLRQQVKKKENEPFLCLSDFVRPLSSGITDTVGFLPLPLMRIWRDFTNKTLINIFWYKHSPTVWPKLPPKRCTNMSAKKYGGMQKTKISLFPIFLSKIPGYPPCCRLPIFTRSVCELYSRRNS